MKINPKTATAAAALLIGAGAWPMAATAQTDGEQIEVEVQEVSPDEGQAAGATEEQADALVEDSEAQAGQTEAEAGQAESTAGATSQPVEVDTSQADLEDTQKQELEAAAAEGRPVPRPEMIVGAQKDGEWLASNLMDREITNANDEDIGDIGDLILAEDGPKGVIVDVGGFLGLGEKQVAIKWSELQFAQDAIMVDATQEALENAPEYMTLEEKQAEAEAMAQQQQLEAEQAGTAVNEGQALPPADQQATQTTDTLEPAMPEEEPMAGEAAGTEGDVEIEVETQN